MKIRRRTFLQITGSGMLGPLLVGCSALSNGTTGSASPTAAAVEGVSRPGFEAFADKVKTTADDQYLHVESDGMPDHPMMIGIRSWQQQVPLPQSYTGDNSWLIPLHSTMADQPISARTGLYRGAIGLAVNGVPIFNALNNRGDDAYLVGELDEWGGHSGRADDYHYHIAPLHLQAATGPEAPIAYALDGFPLYGLDEPDGSPVRDLDDLNGHADPTDGYHYHATMTYPYINGGMRGVVSVQGDQIEPQPRTTPIRPSLTPLQGAVVTGFQTPEAATWELEYQIDGRTYAVNYRRDGGAYIFDFVDPNGQTRTDRYDIP